MKALRIILNTLLILFIALVPLWSQASSRQIENEQREEVILPSITISAEADPLSEIDHHKKARSHLDQVGFERNADPSIAADTATLYEIPQADDPVTKKPCSLSKSPETP